MKEISLVTMDTENIPGLNGFEFAFIYSSVRVEEDISKDQLKKKVLEQRGLRRGKRILR